MLRPSPRGSAPLPDLRTAWSRWRGQARYCSSTTRRRPTPTAAKALASFTDIYWIVGGPKAGGLAGLEPFFPRIARAYLIGEAAYEFAAQLGADVDHVQCGTLDRAIEAAASDARSRAGLSRWCCCRRLAPPTTSSPISRRGKSFRDLVMRLPGKPGAADARQGGHEDHPRR